MRRFVTSLAAAAVAAAPLLPASAGAKTEPIQVSVQPSAQLVDGGSIRVTVAVRCAPFGEPFEANVTVSQDDGFVWTQRGLPAATCDRRWHRYTVVATPFEGSFHRGTAYVSAYVSRMDPATSEVRQGQDARTVKVR